MTAQETIFQIQGLLHVKQDGLVRAGGETIRELEKLGKMTPEAIYPPLPDVAEHVGNHQGPTHGPWPADSDASLRAFYGEPGESQLVTIEFPYPMRLAWETSTVVRTSRCHVKVRDSLRAILEAILAMYGSLEAVREARMDLFGGIYNFRNVRGGNSISRHSWGIAIDIDPDQNGLKTPWPSEATMPREVIDLFRAHGWKSGAISWGRDAMHFQATQN
jgi:hypothetical protein